jgi:hypothetical protein
MPSQPTFGRRVVVDEHPSMRHKTKGANQDEQRHYLYTNLARYAGL